MKAIVLAGGLGTRLRERVPTLPKPMAPVAGRAFLEYVFDRLVTGGITEIILSVGYRADSIHEHFGDHYKQTPVKYVLEDEPLGTGGAILHALSTAGDDPVLVLNGDTLLNLNYLKFIQWYRAASPVMCAMVLRHVPDIARYGSVMLSGNRVSGFVEKGTIGSGLINAGVYIIEPKIFKLLNLIGKFSFEADVLQRHCGRLSPIAYISDAYFIDIGIPEDYDRAQRELPFVV